MYIHGEPGTRAVMAEEGGGRVRVAVKHLGLVARQL